MHSLVRMSPLWVLRGHPSESATVGARVAVPALKRWLGSWSPVVGRTEPSLMAWQETGGWRVIGCLCHRHANGTTGQTFDG